MAPELAPHYRELSLPSVRQTVQRWLDAQEGKYPAEGAPDEYSRYAELAHRITGDRAAYFRNLVAEIEPGPGYRVLCLLARAGVFRSVWTTNFDGLTRKAAVRAGLDVYEVSEDSAARIHRPAPPNALLHVALHGDYRYDALRNTDQELREQNAALSGALGTAAASQPMIVVGYSGRDRSVMRALAAGYRETGPGRLFWCGFRDEEPLPEVGKLITWAREHGHEAYYIQTMGFDDLLSRIAAACLSGDAAAEARAVVAAGAAARDVDPPPFRIEFQHAAGLLKTNAFPVTCPTEVLQFAAPAFTGEGAWGMLRAHTAGTNVVAVPQGKKVLAVGLVDDVRRLFELLEEEVIERVPIDGRDLSREDGAVVSLLTAALVRAVAAARDLDTDGEDLLWTRERGVRHQIARTTCFVQQAALLKLRRQARKDYVLLKPTIRVTDARGAPVSQDVSKEAKRQILGKQWNQQFNDALVRWKDRIFPDEGRTFEFPHGQASTFQFHIRKAPALAKILSASPRGAVQTAPGLDRHVRHFGTIFDEPALIFAPRRGGAEVRDPHPIRGLVQNRPYDYVLTAKGLAAEIRLGVVCPRTDVAAFGAYLARLHQTIQPDSKQEYLLPYPGFEKVFGAALDIPDPKGAWYTVKEPVQGTDIREGALQLRRQLQQAIDALVGACAPTAVVIYIPSRWRPWEKYDLDGEVFDLHDFIKAYCVLKGVATQFIREETTTKRYQCEIAWWLGLSLYVKAMRTPWILDDLDKDTAFVGLGFSLDPRSERGKHVLLGCSHIYSSDGIGLAFRLSKLDEGFQRRGNPFMSKPDARRMGEQVRQLFWETHQRVPSRVVLHKKTPFRREEREGLLEGMHGVEHVDMLEINVDPMLRCVALRPTGGGQFRGDAYPVRRGAAVVIEWNRALLWVHGAADPVTPGPKPYYQGKSRIPAPLVVRRYHGSTGLDVLAGEILGLSKMNWNTFDMYAKLPATIESSNRIAKIGGLLERTNPSSFDYRLFI
ncbi:MAG: SIR2 family protein [Gemmatimonadetes bacterium]|nr:SIR2 family protein [Gemmatimonadota bacterium]